MADTLGPVSHGTLLLLEGVVFLTVETSSGIVPLAWAQENIGCILRDWGMSVDMRAQVASVTTTETQVFGTTTTYTLRVRLSVAQPRCPA